MAISARMHPLSGEATTPPVKPRSELFALKKAHSSRRARLSYDGASDSTEYSRYWANADGKSPDSANNHAVRTKLIKRSRYETESNPYYAGIISTHCNMLVGVGPTLRMMTGSRNFNQMIEREFFEWCQKIQFRRKLWCMAYARTGDGESIGIMQTNPVLSGRVQLDLLLIESEQCQSAGMANLDSGCLDGIWVDEYDNIVKYDILPQHPGSDNAFLNSEPISVPANQVVHWFKLKRGGAHRGTPDLASSLNVGAASRRYREANLAKAETEADYTLFLKTAYQPDQLDTVEPMSSLNIEKRMMTALPNSVEPFQLTSTTPSANYNDFNRSLISEQARPLSMPYNAASCDSSTYSFASGKLDTLCYRAALNVERQDCNDLVLDPLFAMWFREWRVANDLRDVIPNHQWDWPTHPVIDAVQEASATDTKLKNSTVTLRQVFSDQGQDLEDQLVVMAEDMFGEANDETILKARQIITLKNTPPHAIEHVAQIMGLAPIEPEPTQGVPAHEPAETL